MKNQNTVKRLSERLSVDRNRLVLRFSPSTLLIAIRIETDVLKRLKRKADADGKGYQTLINEILGALYEINLFTLHSVY